MRFPKRLFSSVLGSFMLMPSGARHLAPHEPPPRPAIAVEPIAAILGAFESHPVVALSEGEHGNEQGYAFRLSLIRDPRFAATVNDIVVECGSWRYQGLMDRFVSGGDVADVELRE